MESNLGKLLEEEEPDKEQPDEWGRSQRWWRDQFARHRVCQYRVGHGASSQRAFPKPQPLCRAVLLSLKTIYFPHHFNVCVINLTVKNYFAHQGATTTKEIFLSQA